MKLDLEHILERVDRTERDRAEYNRLAEDWEKMWNLEVFTRSSKEMIEQHGQEQVTTPTPYNVVLLAQGLISSQPKIDVPPLGIEDNLTRGANLIEKWLTAMWQQVNRQNGRNVMSDASWQTIVRGRNVFEVKWIGDELPKKLKKRSLPILIRTLDPLNVGIKRGPLYNLWAFHKYQDERINVLQRYPHLKLEAKTLHDGIRSTDEDEQVTVVDFWYISPEDGGVWNAILVNDEFAKKPVETNYPDLPLIESYGDTAPVENEKYRGLSLLHAINDLWRYQCRLMSQMGTGLLYYFWPPVTVQNEFGQPIDDIRIIPGETTNVPWGTKIDMHQMSPNVPLATAMMEKVDSAISHSTFPGVMYGDGGNMQAGFGVSMLSDSAKRRIRAPLENLEFALVQVNALVLGLIEEFGGKDGVDVWGMDTASKTPYRLKLGPDDVRDYRDVNVSLTPQIPSDSMQQQTLGLRLVESKIISRQFYRDHFLMMQVPADEVQQIEFEQALEAPEMQKIVSSAALRKVLGANWSQLIGADQPLPAPFGPPPPPPPGPGGPPPPDGGAAPPGGPPPDMGQGGPPPQGPPPDMGQGGPPPQGPPPPEMMQGGPPPGPPGGPPMGPPPDMGQGGPPPQGPPPPEMMAAMMAQQGAPPEAIITMLLQQGVPPEMIMQIMTQQGVPPEMVQAILAQQQGGQGMQGGPPGIPPGQSPQMLQPPLGGGIPPEMQGQLTPEALGMGSTPNPLEFAALTGQHVSPSDELKMIAGRRNVGSKHENKAYKRPQHGRHKKRH